MRNATLIAADEAVVGPLKGRTIAILGYGAQGQAHALNLRDSGLNVLVGQRPASPRYAAAVADGFAPQALSDVARAADLLIFSLPDDAAPRIFSEEIAPLLRAGQTLGFLHGFVVHYGLIRPPAHVDIILVAPKAQARGVRELFCAGHGPPALIAVAQDASGAARQTALAWAAGIGAGRSVLIESSFADETETDLFGEQAVLCGGLTALVQGGFETLIEAGYPAELAYIECCHELKLLADLICAQGIDAMRSRISSAARFGDLTRGPRIITEAVRAEMRRVLEEVRSGAFAREFLEDVADGRLRAQELAARDRQRAIHFVGERMRRLIFGSTAGVTAAGPAHPTGYRSRPLE